MRSLLPRRGTRTRGPLLLLLVAALASAACGGAGATASSGPPDESDAASGDAATLPDAPTGVVPPDATLDAPAPATDGAPSAASDATSDALPPDATTAIDGGTSDAAATHDAGADGAATDASIGTPDADDDDAPDGAPPPPPADASSAGDAGADASNAGCPTDDASAAEPLVLIEVGDGSTIGYFVVDVGGACPRFLPGAYDASISPDHRHVAYRTPGAPNAAVYVVSVASLDAPVLVDQITGGTTSLFLGAWAPDSSHFTYVRYTPGDASTSLATSATYVAAADGSGARALPAAGGDFVWSADGTQLAAPCVGPAVNPQLGTCVTFACPSSDCTRTSATIADGVSAIAWSPDSKHVAVTSLGLTGLPQLFVVDPTTGSPTQLTNVTDGRISGATWSPSSAKISYLRNLGSLPAGGFLGDVWVACADGSCNDSLSGSLAGATVNAGYAGGGVTWSPTSARVAFGGQQAYGDLPHVFTACPDGSCTTDLGAIGGSAGYLWSSTGAHVYLAAAGDAGAGALVAACPDASCAVTIGAADNASLAQYTQSPTLAAFAYESAYTLYAVSGELGSAVAVSQPGETVGEQVAFTPDGTMLAYETANGVAITTACIDGSCRKATSPAPPAGWSSQFLIGTLVPAGM